MTLSAVFSRCFSTTEVTQPAKSLYRELCRHIKTLPKEAQLYYRNHVRQNFSNFTEEADPETLQRLFARAREDAAWVVNKYKK